MRYGSRTRKYSHGDRWAVGITLLLTPLYYFFPWDSASSLRAVPGVPFVFLYAVLLPGYVLATRIPGRPTDVLVRITTSGLVGLAWFMGVAFAWTLTGLSLGLFQLALPVLIVITVGLGILAPPSQHSESESPLWSALTKKTAEPSRAEKIALGVFAVFLVGIFALVLRSGPPLGFGSDTLDHVGYVSEIAETQSPFPTTAFYKDPGANGADLRKGLLHVFYGFSSGYLRLDSLTVLTWMNAFLAVLLLLSVYSSAFILFGNRVVGMLSAVLFLIALDEGLENSAIRQSFYTHRFGIAFLLFVLAHGLEFLEKGKRRKLVPVIVFSFAAIATHIFFGVLVVLAGLSVAVWWFCFPQIPVKDHLWRVFRLGLAALVGIAPYGLFRFVTAYPGANELHKEVQGVVFVSRHLYIADPIQEYQWFGLVGVLSFLAVFALWKTRDKNAGIGYVFASFFTWGFVLFNPVLLPPVRGALTYLIARLNFLCPFYFIAAYFIVSFFTPRGRETRRKPFAQILAVCLVFAVLVDAVPIFRENTFSRSAVEKEREESYLHWKDALDAIDKSLPPGSVIASDPLTSYSVTAFTPYYAACTFDQHAPPNDMLLAGRMRATRDILSPYVPTDRTTALLGENRATHVIVNDRFPENVRLDYWSMNHEMFPDIRAKFERRPDVFETIYAEDGFVVYRWNGRQAAPDSGFSQPFVVDALPQGWRPVGKLAGEAVLEACTFDEKSLPPGGEIDIRFAWSGRGDYGFRNYAVVVRFDHTNPDLPLDGRPFPKIARKFKEKSTGRIYRFTDFHKVRSGFLSPDNWPPGEIVLDETRVHVPAIAAPGEYTVSVKLLTLQHQPTYRFKDIFSDDDIYTGIPVGRVTIR